jgi:uncharacterized protein (TIGR03437 family)
MTRHLTQCLFAILTASYAFAQPVISSTEVVNSASYLSQGMPGSGIAQGSIFTIFGTGLGPATLTTAGSLPLQTSLGGTSVAVTVNGQTVNTFVLAAVSYQVNALLPSNTPLGSAAVTVTYQNQTSAAEPFQVVSGSFAPYTFNSGGFGQAIATDLNYQSNSIIHTFHPGDWVVLWGTGLGPITGDDSKLPPVGNIGTPTLHVGNASLAPYYAGRSADFPGLDQVIFQVPAGIQGCSVPVAVEINGFVGGGAALIAVSTSGQTCSDSLIGSDLVSKLAAGGTVDFGFVQMYDIILRNETLPTGIAAPDYAQATFSEFTPFTAGFASYGVSEGYCLATWQVDMSPGGLDAGPGITMQGPSTATLPALYSGYYREEFSSNGGQFYWSGLPYTISGQGGKNVGPFTANDTTSVPSAYLSGITAGQTIPLSGDYTVSWTGGNPDLQNGLLTIAAVSNGSGNTYGAFVCTAPLSAQSFTIPKWMMSTLPATTTYNIGTFPIPEGYIWIGQANNPVTFQATGLDRGIVMDEFFNGFPVYFK